MCQFCNAKPSGVVAIVMRERDLGPVTVANLQAYRTTERVGVGHTQASLCSMDLDEGKFRTPDIEARHNSSDCTVGELHLTGYVRRRIHFDQLTAFGLAPDDPFGKTRARKSRYGIDGPDQIDQRGQVVRSHVEHRAGAWLVIEGRIRVP